ncbi:CaiB/BaiF CoA transferase family protein [Chloroflexota bacterium]
MTDSLLNSFRALDLTDEKGFVCGKVLATLGVDVIKVEKPGGDPARNIPPFLNNIPDPEQNLYWLSFNTDKRSITLDLETEQGQDIFKRLVEKADFLIESYPPGYLDGLGLGYESLSRLNPRIIMTSITAFGQKGPYSHYKSCNLVASAMGGVLDSNGDPDRAPVIEAPNSVYFEAGATAALGTVMAHYYRENTGEGQQVDVSLQECGASRDTTSLVVWQFDKRLLKRTGNKSLVGGRRPSRWLWTCKDGYLFWTLRGGTMGARINPAMSKWFDESGMENPYRLVENPVSLDMAGLSEEILDTFDAAIEKLFLKHTKQEIMEKAVNNGIQAWILSTPIDVLENSQPRERNYWTELDNPKSKSELAYPRHFFLSNETENYIRHPAPFIGEHNEEIYSEELGLSTSKIAVLKEANII